MTHEPTSRARRRAGRSLPPLGNFSHSLLAEIFGSGGELPSPGEAVALIERRFEETLPRNAAPLAQPAASVQRARLLESLKNSGRKLVEALRGAGFRIVAMEKEVKGELEGRPFIGYIDCLAAGPSGKELVIDFKYYGDRKYRDLLMDGRAVQLATYAAMRAAENPGSSLPRVAYLVLSRGIVLIPSEDAPPGMKGVQKLADAPPIRDVWERFASALRASDDWLRGECPVPSRPQQLPEEWPEGADLVLDRAKNPDEVLDLTEQPVCRYCEFTALCGARSLF